MFSLEQHEAKDSKKVVIPKCVWEVRCAWFASLISICVSFVPGTYLGGPINPNFKPDSWDLSEDYTFFKNGSFTACTFLGYLKQLIEN